MAGQSRRPETGQSPRHDGVQSIDRAVAILNCFSMDVEELSLGEIADAAHLPKPTVYRLLSALRKHQWIEQDERTGLYRLGFGLFALGAIVGNQMDLRRSALPIMQRLAEETRETVNLNVLDGGERICIELVEGSHAIRNFVKIGTRNSLLAGASGKVLLANLPDAEAAAIIDAAIPSEDADRRQALVQELEMIQRQGYAITYSDRVEGACGISAPVRGKSGVLVAGLTVSGPEERLRQSESHIVSRLLEAAQALSVRMGDMTGTRPAGG
ncbi:IclR family transcriptional regulator [Alicyclobacillus cycloheptanicus]|uniref:DNA-binding IclR family transcriptional regulator n=1 Tax=Alicyclobacillus cycloheptanicus TaxID=1457 RepID=A0ABT9XHZ8_9BACL|nr:IclR family transcriptional regulator [Alicyclobacillus cycloheptanicus]MDQ0189913.1 DNA-binding IclR family transcriptional regulator [Alicyclobacillus cycloheptanicus]WDM02184.1 IclR family transcriptional regulator [Alicyclobacillus cycloheptanicus]